MENTLQTKEFKAGITEEIYFNPASLVKLPVSVMALEKINSLKDYGVAVDSRIEFDSAFACQTAMKFDETSSNRFASVEHFIKKMLLVSDNEAYNRIFEFLGTESIAKKLTLWGASNSAIVQRFTAECDSVMNTYANPYRFLNEKGEIGRAHV